ncbi:MAG: hypothetical protein C0603_07735 [Denitrovibrio sp.]|nr:MAG: hypothetical protein C0603_07735 [Denitrovibrio sp.]
MTLNKTSILLMCDKNHNCDALKKAITELPYDVIICDSRTEAEILQAESPRDIVITEYSLEDTNGVDFLKSTLKLHSGSARIIVGEASNEEHIVKAVIKGIACAYLENTGDSSLIRKKIADIVRIRQSMNNQKLIELLPGTTDLPINMIVYEQLMEAINDEKSVPELAKIISKDVTLTAKVLQVANSAFYGNFSGTSVEKAMLYMGLNPIKDIVLLHSLATNLNMNASQNHELEEIVKHSIETNYYMHAISKKVPNCPISALNNSIGIIHDIGKLVQLVFFPMEYSTIDEYRDENQSADYYTCELATGNSAVKHSEIGAYFLRCWNFNQYSVEAALFHHEPELASEEMKPCVEALFLANTIADIRDGYD